MQIELGPAELQVLEDVLDKELGDLREQIYKTEVAEYKAVLKQREAIVISLLDRVRSLRARPAV
jgi:hypothetical protein